MDCMSGPRTRGWQWTQADDDQLRAMLEAGMKVTEIAPKLKRTVGAVYARAKVLQRIRVLSDRD
jgi:hypothetical protein